MEYVIVLLLANALNQPVTVGAYRTHYATHELCEAARPAAVADVQKLIDVKHPGDKVADSKCVTLDEINKASDKSPHPPLEGQKDAVIH